jgi:hypothetical protein
MKHYAEAKKWYEIAQKLDSRYVKKRKNLLLNKEQRD